MRNKGRYEMDDKDAVKMGQNVCANCGCIIGGSVGYDPEEPVFLCEPCANGEGLCEPDSESVVEKNDATI